MVAAVVSLWSQVEDWLLALVASVWAYPALFATTALDGFFPPVPGETVVVTLAVAARTTGGVDVWAVVLVAAAGAWCGDQVAYAIGRTVGTERVPFLRGPRGRRAVAWASSTLARRGAAFVLAARFVPVGRTAVNMTAGAVGFPRRRFALLSALGATLWSTYSVAIGVVAARWFGDEPLVAVVVGVVVGTLVGVLVDRLVSARATVVPQPPTIVADVPDGPVRASAAAPAADCVVGGRE